MVERRPVKGWEGLFVKVGDSVVLKDTGEEVDFVLHNPGGVKGAAIRGCDPDKVKDAFGAQLPYMERMMLNGG